MESPEQIYQWRVHLASTQPKKATVVVLVAILAGFLGFFMVPSPLTALLGPIVVLLGTADFLLPVSFEINSEGVKSRCGISVSAMTWKEVKRVLETEDGVKLSPLDAGSRLNSFRGVFLRASHNKQEIIDRISYWRSKHAANVGATIVGGEKGENHREDI